VCLSLVCPAIPIGTRSAWRIQVERRISPTCSERSVLDTQAQTLRMFGYGKRRGFQRTDTTAAIPMIYTVIRDGSRFECHDIYLHYLNSGDDGQHWTPDDRPGCGR
jgi:hypothetical protein